PAYTVRHRWITLTDGKADWAPSPPLSRNRTPDTGASRGRNDAVWARIPLLYYSGSTYAAAAESSPRNCDSNALNGSIHHHHSHNQDSTNNKVDSTIIDNSTLKKSIKKLEIRKESHNGTDDKSKKTPTVGNIPSVSILLSSISKNKSRPDNSKDKNISYRSSNNVSDKIKKTNAKTYKKNG
ncbi:hypothetical protein PV325_005309, partial [Microctonus aethiopoides]